MDNGGNGTGSPASQTRHSPAEHLRPYWFKPGQSGNPTGNPKQASFRRKLSDALKRPIDPGDLTKGTKLDGLVKVVLERALTGNRKCLEIILERIDPVARLELSATVKATSEEMIHLLARVRAAALPERDDDGRVIETVDMPALEDKGEEGASEADSTNVGNSTQQCGI